MECICTNSVWFYLYFYFIFFHFCEVLNFEWLHFVYEMHEVVNIWLGFCWLVFAYCCCHCAALIQHVLCCNYPWSNSDSNAMLREKHINPCVGFDFAYLSIQCDWYWPYSPSNGGILNLTVNSFSFPLSNMKLFFFKEEIPLFDHDTHWVFFDKVVLQTSHWTNGSSFHLLLLLSLPS